MKLKVLFGLLLTILSLTIIGCGGGGSSTPTITTVSGEASKGPIIGGDVRIYAIKDGVAQTSPIPTLDGKPVTTKAPFGNYSAVISYAGPVRVEITGNIGSYYMDEATADPLDPTKGRVDFTGTTLRALVANVAGSAKVAVTPYTELAARKAGAALTADSINASNHAVAEAMNLNGVDIIHVMPSKNDQYKFALGVISQAAGPTQTGLKDLLTKVAAGIDVATGAINDPTVISTISDATSTAFLNTAINPTGAITGINPNRPQTVTLTGDQLQGITKGNGPITLSANVTRLAGGPVPNGTPVTFTLTSGTGALTAITTTTNGIATAKLNSNDVGSNTITATADTITSSPLSVDFIFQPITATLKLSTSGILPTGITKITSLIGTVSMSSINPGGLTIKTLANPLSVTGFSADPAVMSLSGAAAALTIGVNSASASAILLPTEVPSLVQQITKTNTKILVPLASFNGGFGLGEFATIVTDVAPLTFPKRSDFVLSGFTALGLDANGAQVSLPGVTVDFTLSLQ